MTRELVELRKWVTEKNEDRMSKGLKWFLKMKNMEDKVFSEQIFALSEEETQIMNWKKII